MPNYDEADHDYYQSRLRVDRENLDEEMVEQPNLFFHVAEGTAYAVSRRDKAKQDLAIEEALVDKEIRDQLQADGEKITEGKVNSLVQQDQDYNRAFSAYLQACLWADRWEALREAFRQRAYILRDLAQLHVTGYFGETVGARERRDAHDRVLERRR